MEKVTPLGQRKDEHLRVNLEKDVQSGITNGLERYRFTHQALPGINLDEIDTTTTLFGKRLYAPILISSMTGGTPESGKLNMALAEAAQKTGIAMGVGSQRVAIEHPETIPTFSGVRKVAPDILLFANLGAIQLNYGYTVDHCRKAVDMIGADALVLHLNPLQEALQTDGNVNFKGLEKKMGEVARKLEVPVIVKEVGWGISEKTAKILANCGVSAIDVAGAGGTSWSQVEMHRSEDEYSMELASLFRDWGISTAASILNVKKAAPEMTIIASGGISNGLEIAKCLALGASVGGMAGKFLKAAAISREEVVKTIELLMTEIRVSMFSAGISSIAEISRIELEKI